jgi:hypothetical protein
MKNVFLSALLVLLGLFGFSQNSLTILYKQGKIKNSVEDIIRLKLK